MDIKIDDIITALKIAVEKASTDPRISRRMISRASDMLERLNIRTGDREQILPQLNLLVSKSFDSTNMTINGVGGFQNDLINFINKLERFKFDNGK